MKAKAMWSSSRSKTLSKGTTLATAPWETSSADTVSPWLAMLHNAYIVCKLKRATLHCLQIENSHTTLSANWKHSQEINTMEERLWSLPTDNPYNRLPHPSSKPVLCNGKVFVWMESRWIHVQIHFNSLSSSIWPCSLPPLPRNEMIGWTTHCPS